MVGPQEVPRVELIARRQADLHGRPDYSIYAGAQLVGRIYQQPDGRWIWAISSIMSDATVGERLSGYADPLDEAKQHFRNAFEGWLPWALAIKATDRNMTPSIAISSRSPRTRVTAP